MTDLPVVKLCFSLWDWHIIREDGDIGAIQIYSSLLVFHLLNESLLVMFTWISFLIGSGKMVTKRDLKNCEKHVRNIKFTILTVFLAYSSVVLSTLTLYN